MMHLANPDHESFLFFYDETKGTGPVERNKIFMNDIFTRRLFNVLTTVKATDKEQKIARNISKLMMREFMKNVDEVDGIALIFVTFVRPSKGIASCLVIFHRGSVHQLETMSKTEVMSAWEDPLDDS